MFPANLVSLITDILGSQTTSGRDHANVHNLVNEVVNALQQRIGIIGSTDPNSLTYQTDIALNQINSINNYINNIIGGNTNTYTVGCVFDDQANDLPTDTATQIDDITVTDGMLVYVKDCLDTGKIGKIYMASVVGTTISWSLHATLGVGDTINVTGGTIYGEKTYVYNDSINNIEIFNGGSTFLKAIETGGSADNYTLTVPGVSSYEENSIFFVAPNFTNIGANPTISINGLTPQEISIGAGNFELGKVYILAYKNSKFILVSGMSSGTGGASIIDEIYGLSWASDTLNGASRKSIYNKIESIAPGGIIGGSPSKTITTNITTRNSNGSTTGTSIQLTRNMVIEIEFNLYIPSNGGGYSVNGAIEVSDDNLNRTTVYVYSNTSESSSTINVKHIYTLPAGRYIRSIASLGGVSGGIANVYIRYQE